MSFAVAQKLSQPQYGRRLLTQVLDEEARANPDRVCFVVPKSKETYTEGARKVTYADLVRAVDRTAWLLESKLGNCSTFETVAYIGPPDIRYFILALGAAKARYKLLLPSPRNSISNHLHLLNVTNCSTFLKPKGFNIDRILDASRTSFRLLDIPPLDGLLDPQPVARYPYESSFNEAADQPCIILHSSGSTGQVKPIILTHRSCAAFDNHHYLRHKHGFIGIVNSYPKGAITLLTMPPFHAGSLYPALLVNLYFDAPVAMLPSRAPVSVSGIVEALEQTGSTMLLVAPSVLADLSDSPRAMALLSKLERVSYGGGALSDHVGSLVSKTCRLQSFIGTTEAGGYPLYSPDDYSKDVEYLRFNPEELGIEFRRRAENAYEIVFVRHSGPPYSSIFNTFPNLDEYSSADLFQPHPSEPGLWKHIGRSDDVIVLSNGEKVVPSLAERVIHQAPEIREVLIYGQKRFQVAAVIEPQPSAQLLDRENFLSKINPYLEEANRLVPTHAKLSNSMILITALERPMIRLPKGAIDRAATFREYEMELDALYSGSTSIQVAEIPFLAGVDKDTTIRGLLDLFSRILGSTDLSPGQDFFVSGIDSLQVITILRHLKAQAEAEGVELPPNTLQASLIYSNPTITQLAEALLQFDEVEDKGIAHAVGVRNMKGMLDKYTKDLPSPAKDCIVVLTGSTGSLGSYLLEALLKDPHISKVYCLNRSFNSPAKQIQASGSRGLSTDWGHRVDFLHAELSKPRLGLDEAIYQLLSSSASHIFHTQWPVNFNLPLSTFEPHIQGVRNLIDLASLSPRNPVLLFTSTISTAGNWSAICPGHPVPESWVDNPIASQMSGYAQSKWVSEGLLSAASRVSGLDARIVRVGQLAGSVDMPSVWNKDEWFPCLVASSDHLSLLPSSIGSMSKIEFVPVDKAAAILVEIAFNKYPAAVYNLVNPNRTSWSALAPVLSENLRSHPKIVPYPEWVSALEASADDQNIDLDKNPAVKLLDFFKGQVDDGVRENIEYSTDQTQRNSLIMQKLQAVNPEWVKLWLQGWQF